ncbi:MAG: methyltransferase [Bacteroidota bacterium]|nr:methyltransferase [Bacteroidota bacterium]
MKKEISSPQEYMEMVNAFRVSRILLTSYELGIFSKLDNGPVSSETIAHQIQANPRATDRLLNALTALGVIRKKSNLFFNTPFASQYLSEGKPDYLGGIGHNSSLWNTWSSLTDAVRQGHSVASSGPIGSRDQEYLEAFIAAMHARGVPQSVEIVGMLDFSGVKKILDVGGGSGAFSFEFLHRIPGCTATILDLPAVIPITKRYVVESGLKDRITLLPGDYLKDDFGGKYDLIYLSAILHINSPEENQLLIAKCSEALNDKGHLVIMDHIMSDDRTEPPQGAIFALNMLVGTQHGDTYTEKEIAGWMTAAGIDNISRKTSAKGTSILSGLKR